MEKAQPKSRLRRHWVPVLATLTALVLILAPVPAQLLGLMLLALGVGTFGYAFGKPIEDGKVFSVYFAVAAILGIWGFAVLWT